MRQGDDLRNPGSPVVPHHLVNDVEHGELASTVCELGGQLRPGRAQGFGCLELDALYTLFGALDGIAEHKHITFGLREITVDRECARLGIEGGVQRAHSVFGQHRAAHRRQHVLTSGQPLTQLFRVTAQRRERIAIQTVAHGATAKVYDESRRKNAQRSA